MNKKILERAAAKINARRRQTKIVSASIVPIIIESERVLARAIKHFGLTVKPEQICLTIQSKGRRQALGWFAPEWWRKNAKGGAKGKEKSEPRHEINLSAEYLQEHNMGETLLHELAHAENQVLGIRDCANRAHNKHFKTVAERLGLKVLPRDKSVGFGYTDLAPVSEKFLADIKFDRALFDAHRGTGGGSKKKVGSRLIKCECSECGYVVRTTQKWLDDAGAPLCPCNENAMEVA
jgi:hypothetical protein